MPCSLGSDSQTSAALILVMNSRIASSLSAGARDQLLAAFNLEHYANQPLRRELVQFAKFAATRHAPRIPPAIHAGASVFSTRPHNLRRLAITSI